MKSLTLVASTNPLAHDAPLAGAIARRDDGSTLQNAWGRIVRAARMVVEGFEEGYRLQAEVTAQRGYPFITD